MHLTSNSRVKYAQALDGIVHGFLQVSVKAQNLTQVPSPPQSQPPNPHPLCRYIPPQLPIFAILDTDENPSIRDRKDSQQFTRLNESAIMGRPGRSAGFDKTEYDKRKDAVTAVIDFNDAHHVPYSKTALYKYYGIGVSTGQKWFSGGATVSFRKTQQSENIPNENKSPSLKRSRSEDPAEETPLIKTDPHESPATIRQNPLRNSGRDGKKLKSLVVEDVTERAASVPTPPPISPPSTADASPPRPPPRQLLTPPRAKMGGPRKRVESRSGHESPAYGECGGPQL